MSKVVMSRTPWERCAYPVLKQCLEQTNMNQSQLAEALHTTQTTVSRWSLGDQETTIQMLFRLEDLTGRSFRELFENCTLNDGRSNK